MSSRVIGRWFGLGGRLPFSLSVHPACWVIPCGFQLSTPRDWTNGRIVRMELQFMLLCFSFQVEIWRRRQTKLQFAPVATASTSDNG